MPYPQYQGRWEKGTEVSDLKGFFTYLKNLNGCILENVALAERQNWIFKSNIPLGYGLGSSGALSAAAYGAFFEEEALRLGELKDKLAEIESFFHGKSSGLDPLVSYTGQAVYVNQGQITTIVPPRLPSSLTLYDSGQKRNGKPLIKGFLERVESEPDFAAVVDELRSLNADVISLLLVGEDISQAFQQISRLQLEHFRAMIPESVYELWKDGLDEGRFMKLSGAGGGGCYLVLA